MQTPESSPAGTGHDKLLKVLGVTFGIAVTIGGMIGLGILRTPGLVAGQLQSVWLIMMVWVLGAVYAILGIFSAAELGTTIQRTGGWYAYAHHTLGEFAGFAVGWMDWISYPATLALASIAASEYIISAFPAVGLSKQVLAVIILLGLGLLNWIGIRAGSRIQEITSFAKAIIFLILVGACFLYGPTVAAVEAPVAAPLSLTAFFGAVIISLQSVIYAYDGWYAAIYFNEETKNAGKDIPRSMFMAVGLVAAIYLLVNLALIYVLPMSELAASELPVADAANLIFGSNGKFVITILAVVTLLSILNSNLLSGPRILFAMSRDGLFAAKAAEVNRGGTPWFGLLLTVGASLPLIFLGTFETLLAITAFLFILLYVSGYVSLLVLRRREPERQRPYKAWGYPWTTIIVLIGSMVFLAGAVAADTTNALYALLLILLSYPAYLITKRLKAKMP